MRQTLTLDGWPTLANVLLRMHHHRRNRQLRADYLWIAAAARDQGLTPATGRRRVSVVYRYTTHAPDPDAGLKVLLDGLVCAGLLLDDDRKGLELGGVTHEKAPAKGMLVTLEDV